MRTVENFSTIQEGTTNAGMHVSMDLQSLYAECVTVSLLLFTSLCSSTCDILHSRANHVEVSITHLYTVRAGCSEYLSVWEAVCIEACECPCVHLCAVVVVNVCM